jgi:hypothetical protein
VEDLAGSACDHALLANTSNAQQASTRGDRSGKDIVDSTGIEVSNYPGKRPARPALKVTIRRNGRSIAALARRQG